ncbi:MAG: hypothetical protein CMP67_04910 [Flavobacteriales bacterium]|nr:hypothetical protein [Flavobacteriales bacterium]|tara:strand:- start:2285 stop:3643 length:1359 start_codon:yes stop_codon:yes gene_type:complete
MSNNNFIIVDGKPINENEIPHFYPLSIVKYQPSYNSIIRFIVEEVYGISKKSKKYPVYINLLASKSLKVKYLAILLEISKNHNLEEVHLDYLPRKVAEMMNISFRESEKKIDLIDKRERFATLPKYIANLLFSLFGFFIRKQKGEKPESVVRAWVDVDEKLHKDEFEKSMIYIYPFGINFKRSIKFIRKVFKSCENVSLRGINYSAYNTLKVIFSKELVHALVDFEYTGMKSHSKTMLKFKKIYTSDEFQVAAPIIYRNKKDTFVLNRAHGMGCYNLEINYDEFHLFNTVQQEFYSKNNPFTKYKTYPSESSIQTTNVSQKTSFFVVYIDQGDLTKYHYFYEANLQKKLVETLQDINNQGNKKVFVKYHPNRNEKEKKDFYALYGLESIQAFNESENYVFINLYSTSYFDYKKFGSFLFVKDHSFSPKYFFGDDINSIHIDKLKNTLLSYEN